MRLLLALHREMLLTFLPLSHVTSLKLQLTGYIGVLCHTARISDPHLMQEEQKEELNYLDFGKFSFIIELSFLIKKSFLHLERFLFPAPQTTFQLLE